MDTFHLDLHYFYLASLCISLFVILLVVLCVRSSGSKLTPLPFQLQALTCLAWLQCLTLAKTNLLTKVGGEQHKTVTLEEQEVYIQPWPLFVL